MITIKNLYLHFGERTLFNHINATFDTNDKVGIVGRNGSGKSTLLKIIAGTMKADEGEITAGRNTTIAYMPQEMVMHSTKTVFDEALSVFNEFLLMQKKAHDIEQALATNHPDAENLLDEYTYLLEKLSLFDEQKARDKAYTILYGLGFTPETIQKTVDTLSVGWKMRLVLTKLLLQNADFYLFDEPTNHLDLSTQEWFFNFLKNESFGYLLVSHDRYFLDHACTKIYELENSNGTLYYGNFSKYLHEKEERRAALESAYQRQQKEIAHKEKVIDKFRAKASKARQAQSMIKKLEKMELIELEPVLPKVHLSFPSIERPGKVVLTVHNMGHSFNNTRLFEHASCDIMRGDKVALIAPNGTGKTTFFNLITKKLPLQQGSFELGHNVTMAYFEQDQTRVMNGNNTIFEEVRASCDDITDGTIRAFLGSFLFSGNDIHKKIKVLSGGEKNRVAMVKVLLKKANFLILDEPTNHLDLYTKDILLQALKQYAGTVLIVSHDHDFIQKLATRVLELTPNGLHNYPGDYETYLLQRAHATTNTEQTKTAAPISAVSPKATDPSIDNSATHNRVNEKKRVQLERKIQQLEHKNKKLEQEFLDLVYGTDAYDATMTKYQKITAELNELMRQWEELTD